jgi:cold shock CspA family protein
MTGVVRKWSPDGFGFLRVDDGQGDEELFKRGLFVHVSNVRDAEGVRPYSLEVGQRCRFDVVQGDRGLAAVDVELL